MGARDPGAIKTDTLTEEQSAILRQLNEQTGGKMSEMFGMLDNNLEGNQTYQNAINANAGQLSEFDPARTAQNFDQYIGNPQRENFQQQTIPGIAERYAGVGGARSGASQLAMTGAANDFERNLGAQKSNTMLTAEQQKEQIRNQAIQQALGLAEAPGQQNLSAIDRYTQLMNQGFNKQFEVGIDPGSEGLWPSIIAAGGSAAGAAGAASIAASSRKIKENIKEYNKGLEVIENMSVKQYDYKEEFIKDSKDKVGLIAEELPEEIQEKVNGNLHVDLYGLLAITVNAIKELSEKVKKLEEK